MGGGFAMGCAAGCLIYLVRGMWLSPKSERLYGGVMLLKKRAPILGGNLFSIKALSVCGQDYFQYPIAY